MTVTSGAITVAVFTAAAVVAPAAMLPVTSPLSWPALPLLPLLATLVAATPAWVAPPVPSTFGASISDTAKPRRADERLPEPTKAVAA